MNVADGCKVFTVQMDEKLAERIVKVSSSHLKMTEFLRRAALDLVERLEKAGDKEYGNWNGPNFDGVRRNLNKR